MRKHTHINMQQLLLLLDLLRFMRFVEDGKVLDEQINPRRFKIEVVQHRLNSLLEHRHPSPLMDWELVYNETAIERLHANVLRLNAEPANHSREEPIHDWIRIATLGIERIVVPWKVSCAEQLIWEIAEAIISDRLTAKMLCDPSV